MFNLDLIRKRNLRQRNFILSSRTGSQSTLHSYYKLLHPSTETNNNTLRLKVIYFVDFQFITIFLID